MPTVITYIIMLTLTNKFFCCNKQSWLIAKLVRLIHIKVGIGGMLCFIYIEHPLGLPICEE